MELEPRRGASKPLLQLQQDHLPGWSLILQWGATGRRAAHFNGYKTSTGTLHFMPGKMHQPSGPGQLRSVWLAFLAGL